MTRPIVAFIGPTIDRTEAMRYLDALYLPPAEAGAIVAAVKAHDPRAILLIDGVFAKAPAVRHKEILWALDRGCAVAGAASIGALRAAELSPYGMIGHGLIYRWYRLTPLADDDEVAVAMSPAEIGARALSEALINIRLTLARAERAGIVAPAVRHELVEIARATHFLERTWPRLLDAGRARLGASGEAPLAGLEAWVARHAVDQKRTDAVSLLHAAASAPGFLAPPAAAPRFVLTEAWDNDLAAAGIDLSRLGAAPSGRPWLPGVQDPGDAG